MTPLQVLLVDDDAENLSLLTESLPATIGTVEVQWDACDDFEEALSRVERRRYDAVVSDIYRDREGRMKTPATGDIRALDIVKAIRQRRFCPILLFTDGTFPLNLDEGPFLRVVDKSHGNGPLIAGLTELFGTGVPQLACQLHDELDRTAGSYLWSFLETRWGDLEAAGLTNPGVLERVVRRRAAVMLSRLDPTGLQISELEYVEGAEFYLHPPLTGDLRLGAVIRSQTTSEFRVVLTPHCFLVVRPGSSEPGADFVLTVRTVPAKGVVDADPPAGGTAAKRLDGLRQRVQSPALIGRPRGRYWFLPGFLEIPDLYADLLQVESVSWSDVADGWECVAVLDSPFAEALQSCFGRFYSAVGLPEIKPESLKHLLVEE